MADRIARFLASDHSLRVAGYATALLVLAMVVLAGLTIPSILSNTQASRRTDDLASCRASFRAAIDDANLVVLEANWGVTIALGASQTALSDAVVASIRQDPTTLALIAAELEVAEERKAAAYAALGDAFGDLSDANQSYTDAIQLSREDPRRFLANCKEQQ